MSENDIAKFLKWAVDLGCPLGKLPNNEYLKRIFRSNHSEKLLDMMKRIRPRSEVIHIRDNIIKTKIRKVDGQINKLMLPSLPLVLQRYTHLENLKYKIELIKNEIKHTKLQIENLSKSLESENCDYLQIKQNLNISIDRIYTTEKKNDLIIKQLKSLADKKSSVDYILLYNKQIIGNEFDQNTENAKALINVCVEYLYDNKMEHYDQETVNHLKQILNSITNINKWNVISTLSNDQIKLIKSLSDKPKFKNENFRYTVLLSKLYAAHIKTELKLKKLNIDCEHFNSSFEEHFTNADKIITKKFDMFNSSILSSNQNINRNEFLLSFIESVITKYIQLDEMRFLNLQIDIINTEIEEYENVYTENQNNVHTFDIIYNNIMKSINNIKKYSTNIASTNGKLIYLKKTVDYLMNEIFENNNNFRKIILNDKYVTTMAMESFYDDSIFCSTKIGCDFDNMSRMETTLLSTNPNNQSNFFQSQLAEFQLFLKLPFIRNSYLPSKFNILIVSNQILNYSINEILKKIFKNHLNTGRGIMDCLIKNLELCDLLKHHSSRRIDFEIPFDGKCYGEINRLEIQTKLNEQKENLKSIINHVNGLIVNTKLKLDQNALIINLLLENEFKKYVSAMEKINGHTYKQLENELKLNSRI